jgi:hypothetical protein
MKKLLLIAAALCGLASPAQAELWSKAGVPAGTWCETPESGAEGWMFFKRGKCAPGDDSAVLVLKAHGDYTITGGDELVCKVDPKSYFKGWADYSCTFYGGSVRKLPKETRKFLIDIDTGVLMLGGGRIR